MGSISPGDLGEWFDAYAAALSLYARQWLDTGLAEDAVQEVFIRLMNERRPPANVKAWLFRSVRNESISRLRSVRRREVRDARHGAEQGSWFQTQPGDRIDARAAQATLESLPDEQREVIMLRIWGEMTLQEIGEMLSVPISTVFSRYQAGLDILRRRMEHGIVKTTGK